MDPNAINPYPQSPTPTPNQGTGVGSPLPSPSQSPPQASGDPTTSDVDPDNPNKPRKEYVVAKHVAILDEHPMSATNDVPAQYCGPNELAEIAQNNNARIYATGDATPIIIGHTTDGKAEKSQPQIVGFATNFEVGPLFDTGRTALFADFHILRDRVQEVNQYPRRSVELWPKRWEIDPISLLGATTPERDLGLLQLSRQQRGQPIRYSRMSPKTPMQILPASKEYNLRASSTQRRYQVADEKPRSPAPPENGDGDEANASIVAAVLQSAPIQQLLAQQQEIMSLLQGEHPGEQADAPGGDAPMPDGSDAPGGDAPAGAPPGMDAAGGDAAGPGGTDMPGGDSPQGQGQVEPEAAWYHEGPPERYDMEDMETTNSDDSYNGGGEGHYCYGAGCDHPSHAGPMPGTGAHPEGIPYAASANGNAGATQYGMNGDCATPSAPPTGKPMRKEMAYGNAPAPTPTRHGMSYASATDDYIPTNEGKMTTAPTKGKTAPVRNSRHDEYVAHLATLANGDQTVKQSRTELALTKQVSELTKQVQELMQDKVRYARSDTLRVLQSQGIELDVAEEVADTLDMSEDTFTKHVEKIKKRYSKDPTGQQMIRIADTGVPGKPASPESRLKGEQLHQYSRDLSERAFAIRQANPTMPVDKAVEQATQELAGVKVA